MFCCSLGRLVLSQSGGYLCVERNFQNIIMNKYVIRNLWAICFRVERWSFRYLNVNLLINATAGYFWILRSWKRRIENIFVGAFSVHKISKNPASPTQSLKQKQWEKPKRHTRNKWEDEGQKTRRKIEMAMLSSIEMNIST